MLVRRPLREALSYPVSAGLAAMATAITALKATGWDIEPLTMTEKAFGAEPWRLVASALPHGDFFHLLFNVYWLWIFGAVLERVLGHARMLVLVVLLAAGSAAAEYALFTGGIGLSGVGYGLFGMLVVLQRRDARFADTMDRQTTILFIGWFFLCIGLTAADVWHIANVAHGVGAILGALAGLALSETKPTRPVDGADKPPGLDLRIAGYAGFLLVFALSFVGGSVARAHINLSPERDMEFALAAQKQFEAGDFEGAIDNFRRATEIDPKDARNWYNLGVSHERLNQYQQAHECYQQAAKLEPSDARYRSAADRPAAQP